jgi:hypothetical protein
VKTQVNELQNPPTPNSDKSQVKLRLAPWAVVPRPSTHSYIDERRRRLKCVCPRSRVVERGRQCGCTFIDKAELVAQRVGLAAPAWRANLIRPLM